MGLAEESTEDVVMLDRPKHGLFEEWSALSNITAAEWVRELNTADEHVVCVLPMPIGLTGSLMIDGKMRSVPMVADARGMIASISKAARGLGSNGIITRVTSGEDLLIVRAVALWRPSEGVGASRIAGAIARAVMAEDDPSETRLLNREALNAATAVGIATGQDIRAIEALATEDACASGVCRALATYAMTEDEALVGALTLRFAAREAAFHPIARLCRNALGLQELPELAAAATAVGLARSAAVLLGFVTT